jgi:hypothetical protein
VKPTFTPGNLCRRSENVFHIKAYMQIFTEVLFKRDEKAETKMFINW